MSRVVINLIKSAPARFRNTKTVVAFVDHFGFRRKRAGGLSKYTTPFAFVKTLRRVRYEQVNAAVVVVPVFLPIKNNTNIRT